MNEEEMMIQDINENCYELYSEEYVEQLQQENTQLQQQLKDKDEKISKAIE
jgi:formiminotetrahydrofolate cyclodeaminase